MGSKFCISLKRTKSATVWTEICLEVEKISYFEFLMSKSHADILFGRSLLILHNVKDAMSHFTRLPATCNGIEQSRPLPCKFHLTFTLIHG